MFSTHSKKLPKKLPKYTSDEDAENFVAESDLSEYDLSGFRRLSEVVEERRAGRPALGDRAKEHVSLRLDREVIAKFKRTGKGWQGRINDVLRNSRPAGGVKVSSAGPAMAKAAMSAPKAAAAKAAKPAASLKAATPAAKKSTGAKAASKAAPKARRPAPAAKKRPA